MTKTILITGSTDGIGLLTAQTLAAEGHTILLHGRNPAKLEAAAKSVGGTTEQYIADLSKMAEVYALATAIREKHSQIDVVINNAGILKAPSTVTEDGYDIRFMVNTFAPYALTVALLPIIAKDGCVVNLCSAAQAPVNLDALRGRKKLDDMGAYTQSKLAITIWSREMAKELPDGPVIVAVNPASLLASKMVKEGFGIAGNDLSIGANILREAALGASFADASGKYFDNDSGQFAQPHAAALDAAHSAEVMQGIKDVLAPPR
ncbi:SDR family NAD(P)-dependent oxidoreductase [Sulfitobacter sp. CW3]|uniref:SDR family NAD(P)-dependent oxidoreductase n=1 Tax=Sulfitobacter sp. CW3 TaxID=2861965 RepID=UPI001C5F510E|nr:SDR family NAD(P)-dependent oxidoreductase [Sulfitobacter sp. CW3]MBW4961622.1 SDR family NAD(P)-dependent oxidoreductase [Sulfitobacter sp. CW3]